MRSRRHRLQVSTFPFLAVLLCAMGALLLVLLVMDRRAHDAARARAEQAAHKAAEDSTREAEANRAALEEQRQAARAAMQRERDEGHARLAGQVADAQGQVQSVRDQIAQAAARMKAEQEDEAALKKKIDADQAKASEEERALSDARAAAEKEADQSEANRQARAAMTADLAQLERTLAELRAARERDTKTYSVVPYHGKRGEDRQPLYVECTSAGVVFHPDRTLMAEARLGGEAASEVSRRLARQKEQLPAGKAASFAPYLMLLVRPDGVTSYYRLRDALHGLKIDFGYEFIDNDWALEFPATNEAAPPQAWMTAAKPADGGPAAARPADSPVHGVPAFHGTERPAVATPDGAAGDPASGSPTVAVAAPGDGSGPSYSTPSGPSGPADPPAVALGPPRASPGAAGVHPGAGAGSAAPALAGTPGGSGGPGSGSPTSIAPAQSAGASGATPPGSPGVPAARPIAERPEPAAAKTGPGFASDAGPAHGPGGDGSNAQAPPSPPSNDPPPLLAPAAASPGAKAPGGAGAGAPDAGEEDPFLRAPPSPPLASKPAPALRPARLSGDRDWVLYVECKPEGVVVYPTQLLIPTSAFNRPGGGDMLLQAIQQLIDRKQATVRHGEAPYRPEVRFLVHPDAVRTYHLAYPTLDNLNAAKTAQDLGPDDDVSAIVRGH